MRNISLSLPALRKYARNRSSERNGESRVSSDNTDHGVKRREFIGMAGAAFVGSAPILKALDSATIGPFRFESSRRRAIFKLGQKECWVIDTARFSGNPDLLVERTTELIRVTLTGAKYPGTELPADLKCEVKQGISGWRMDLRLALGGFKSNVDIEPWLAGRELAKSKVRLDHRVCTLGDEASVLLRGPGTAAFRPDWTLTASGSHLAVVSGLDGESVADAVTLSLPGPDEQSIMCKAPARRTKLLLQRGRNSWSLEQWVRNPDGWRLSWMDDPFDLVEIEAGESGTGRVRQALLIEPHTDGVNLHLQAPKGWHDINGQAFKLPLRDTRCAWAFDGRDRYSALIAQYSDEPVWLQTKGCCVQLGQSDSAAPFEMVTRNGGPPKVKCEPAVLSATAPMDGAITGPLLLAEGALMMLAIGQQQTPVQEKPAPPPVRPQVRPPVQQQPTAPPVRPSLEPAPGTKVMPKVVPQVQQEIVAAAKLKIAPLKVSVTRPEDMLSLEFQFANLVLKSQGNDIYLERKDAQAPSSFMVIFPPQSIGEQSFLEAGNEGMPGGQVAATRLAGPTQLGFRLPKGVDRINYSLEALLDWSRYEPVLAPAALPPPPPPAPLHIAVGKVAHESMKQQTPGVKNVQDTSAPRIKRTGLVFAIEKASSVISAKPAEAALSVVAKPEIIEPTECTAIELPYRLTLSPSLMAGWAHSLQPVKSGEWIELWHTRLGVKKADGSVDEKDEYYRTLRAIWSPDYNPDLSKKPPHFKPPNDPSNPRLSLDAFDRFELVHLTSNANLPNWRSRVVQADQLMLSPLGAWIKSRYAADPPELKEAPATGMLKLATPQASAFSIESWQHQAAMGRDYYVRVVYRGFLYPFGHRASLIKITERKIRRVGDRGLCAVLVQRMFIVVREPEKFYDDYPVTADVNRRMPLRRVRIITKQTPDLNTNKGGILGLGQGAFWPILPGQGDAPFSYHIAAEDVEGQTQEFSMPLAFIEASTILDLQGNLKTAGAKTVLENIIAEVEKPVSQAMRTAALVGQNVSLAPSHPTKPGGTNFEAGSLRFTAVKGPSKALLMMPVVDQAVLLVPAIQQFVGEGAPASFTWQRDYVNTGFSGANDSLQAFLTLVGLDNKPPAQTPELSFGADKAGGMVNPVLRFTGMSRLHGPVGAPGARAAYDPKAPMAAGEPRGEGGAYGGAGLGDGIDPKELLGDSAKLLGGVALNQLLNLVSFGSGDEPRLTNSYDADSNSIKTEFSWNPKLTKSVLVFVPGSGCQLKLNAQMVQKLDKTAPKCSIKGEINNFQIDLLRPATTFMTVHFQYFKFSSETGKETSVDPKITGVTFGGPLNFINTLKNYLNSSALGSGPCLDVTKDGVVAGFNLAIPSIGVGVFTLENVRLGAMLNLPFTGDPLRFRFNFCDRQNPFALTVSMFGGGGYFSMCLGLHGVEMMEASLEFGASVSLNLGVASGGAHIMAGIYFAMEGNECLLSGYLRCGGELNVLGIIHISVEFYLSLNYQSAGNRVWGQASLTVEIEILFFSFSVTLTVEREFSNSSSSASLGGVQVAALEPFLFGLPSAAGGADRLSFESLMSESDWAAYCGAFA